MILRPSSLVRVRGLGASLLVGAVLCSAFPSFLGAQAVKSSAPARSVPAVGTPVSPPQAIEGLDARPVVPLEFSRAWLGKAKAVRQARAELDAEGRLDGASPEELAELGAALSGVLRVPVIPVVYGDVDVPFPEEVLADRLFGPIRGDTVSYSAYWDEVSGGLLQVEGEVLPWVRLRKPARHYLSKDDFGWASFGRVVEFREAVLRAADRMIDFSRFDNDGPDGIPNSGDDDGFVDFVAFLYVPKCTGDWREGAIWPHRGAMEPFETSSIGANGEPIRIADYVILPAVGQGSCEPLDIGVLAHETGHALGLPDLYGYDGSSQGIGAWGLMGTGSHSASYSPAHLSAWSKEQLGWVRVEWITGEEETLEIEPVVESRTVYRYDLPGDTREYLLFENRQRIGSDKALPGSGLLAWRIDPDLGELMGWNGGGPHAAVRLIQADERGALHRGGHADAGDPFPGESGRTTLEIEGAPPLRLSAIDERDGTIHAEVELGFSAPTLVGSPSQVRLAASAGDSIVSRVVTVRREGGAGYGWTPSVSASWLRATRLGDVLVLSAETAGLPPGEHTGAVELELPGEGTAGRIEVQLTVTAPGAPEIVAADIPWSWGLTARSGLLFQAGYSWDPLTLRPQPRLLHLRAGTDLARTLARIPAEALYAPVHGPDDDVYVLARVAEENLLYRVAPDGGSELVTRGLGTAPAYGAAALHDGSILVANWTGEVQRVLPDGAILPWSNFGRPIYQIAADHESTLYAASLDGNVLRLDTQGRVRILPTGFGRGRLVAITATPSGTVFAAERGGKGRIVRIERDGTTREIGRVPGAQFYGLAVDGNLLYAVDLGNRQLLRVSIDGPVTGEVAASEP